LSWIQLKKGHQLLKLNLPIISLVQEKFGEISANAMFRLDVHDLTEQEKQPIKRLPFLLFSEASTYAIARQLRHAQCPYH
jgi:hypothetical protein